MNIVISDQRSAIWISFEYSICNHKPSRESERADQIKIFMSIQILNVLVVQSTRKTMELVVQLTMAEADFIVIWVTLIGKEEMLSPLTLLPMIDKFHSLNCIDCRNQTNSQHDSQIVNNKNTGMKVQHLLMRKQR